MGPLIIAVVLPLIVLALCPIILWLDSRDDSDEK